MSLETSQTLADGAALLAAAGKTAERLPPTTRAALMMALLGIALVGLLLIVSVLLGGHWVRRQGAPRRGPVVPPDRAPLRPLAASQQEPFETPPNGPEGTSQNDSRQ